MINLSIALLKLSIVQTVTMVGLGTLKKNDVRKACDCTPFYNGFLCEHIACEYGYEVKDFFGKLMCRCFDPHIVGMLCEQIKCEFGGKPSNGSCICTNLWRTGKFCENNIHDTTVAERLHVISHMDPRVLAAVGEQWQKYLEPPPSYEQAVSRNVSGVGITAGTSSEPPPYQNGVINESSSENRQEGEVIQARQHSPSVSVNSHDERTAA
uniref:EGF-like domain-containing protein n=1 Tax=Syphacia muris TaxID=451379 RepID=A0A0N5AKN0_9BILA